MITDIPTAEEFQVSGVAFLNLGWEAAVHLSLTLKDIEIESWDDGSVTDEYWRRAQRPLATAVALTQQGTEFLLKSRIAATSPFLLLSGGPRDWPKDCDKRDAPYAAFHSIDAQDLLRAYDTVSPVRLSDSFRKLYNEMRQTRNSVFHTVDKQRRFNASAVIITVLKVTKELLPNNSWISLRKAYIEQEPSAQFHRDGPEAGVAPELRHVIDLLAPADCAELLGIQKKQRFYYCPDCAERMLGIEGHVMTAQLRPNEPTSETLYCYACEAARHVRRHQCQECPGNVVDAAHEICLTCGDEYPKEPIQAG